jgi:hypothetical protein
MFDKNEPGPNNINREVTFGGASLNANSKKGGDNNVMLRKIYLLLIRK